MAKPRLTPFRAPPRYDTPIGVLYRHIQATLDAEGAFTIAPLIGERVWDAQSKLNGTFSVRSLHNKLAVLRKHYGVPIVKMKRRYWFRVDGVVPVDPLDAVEHFLPEFEGKPFTKEVLFGFLQAARLKLST